MSPEQVELRFRQLEAAREEGRLLERVYLLSLIEASSGMATNRAQLEGLNLAFKLIKESPLGTKFNEPAEL